MSQQTLMWILVASTIAGTLGGALEKTAAPGGFWYKAGVFLASLGVDLVSLRKLAGAGALAIVLIGTQGACLSSAPVVPVTPANQAQISSCQSSAAVHNDVVIGGFVLGGIGAGLGSAGAVVTDSGQQKALAIGAAIAGGLTLIDSAIVGFSAQNFANGNCTAVVGALPVTPLGSTTVTVTAPAEGAGGPTSTAPGK